jgi:carbon-monoxide dehydrogenase small subunit
MSGAHHIRLTVNGREVEGDVEPRTSLGSFLRETLRLTGTHFGCEHGVCGACTVLLDGDSVRSCLLFAVQADGAVVETVESLAPAGEGLGTLQQAFHDHHALQCGFCTPGILMTLSEYLRDHPDPTDAELRIAISGNLCRCTGYETIIKAALAAAAALRQAG